MTSPNYPPPVVVMADLPITLRSSAGHFLDVACGDCGKVHRLVFAVPAGDELKVAVDVHPAPQLTVAHRQATNRS